MIFIESIQIGVNSQKEGYILHVAGLLWHSVLSGRPGRICEIVAHLLPKAVLLEPTAIPPQSSTPLHDTSSLNDCAIVLCTVCYPFWETVLRVSPSSWLHALPLVLIGVCLCP